MMQKRFCSAVLRQFSATRSCAALALLQQRSSNFHRNMIQQESAKDEKELKDPFSADAQSKREATLAKFLSDYNEREFAYLKNLPLSAEKAMEAMQEVFAEVKAQKAKFNEISKTPLSAENVVQKFNESYVLLSNIRQAVAKKFNVKDENALRYLVGHQSKANDDLALLVKSIYAFIAEQAFGIKLKNQFADGRAIAIFVCASEKTPVTLIETIPAITAKYSGANYNQTRYIEDELMPTMFKHELDALKIEEDIDLTVRKNIQLFDDSINKGIESVRVGFAKKKAEKEGTAYVEETKPEQPLPELEKKQFATPEGWLQYKLHLAECLYRCSTHDEYQPRYMTADQADARVKEYKAKYIDAEKKQ